MRARAGLVSAGKCRRMKCTELKGKRSRWKIRGSSIEMVQGQVSRVKGQDAMVYSYGSKGKGLGVESERLAVTLSPAHASLVTEQVGSKG